VGTRIHDVEHSGGKWRNLSPIRMECDKLFTGEYNHSIDSKGRVILPAKFRELLGDTFVMTKGLDDCLFIYTQEEWAALTAKLRELSFTQSNARAFARLFFSGAAECSVDSQGRTVIPPNLREHAGLDRDAVIIGVSTHVEVWSAEAWRGYSQRAREGYEEAAERLVGLSL